MTEYPRLFPPSKGSAHWDESKICKSCSLVETWLCEHIFSINVTIFSCSWLHINIKKKYPLQTCKLWLHTHTERGRGLLRHSHHRGYHKLSKALCLIGWACNLSRMSQDLVAKATTGNLPAQPYFLCLIVIFKPNIRSILIICIFPLYSTLSQVVSTCHEKIKSYCK